MSLSPSARLRAAPGAPDVLTRSAVVAAEENPLVRAVAKWLANRRYAAWRKAHPGASFGDFYAATITAKLTRGRRHPTLGQRGWKGAGKAADWDRASFAARGAGKWARIQALGVRPDMRCVDYGCGSLRIGQHAIRALAPDHYFGLDVTDHFFRLGLEMIDPALLEEKQPRLAVIGDEAIAAVRAWRPDFIFANAVLQHVPPDDLLLFFERLERMMAPQTVACVIFVSGSGVEQIGAMSWRYGPATLAAAAAAAAPGLSAGFEPYNSGAEDPRGRERMVLTLRNRALAAGIEAQAAE
ncbi:MAG: hypothetical protein ACM3YM_04945 [Sphingomonadales bacterium]